MTQSDTSPTKFIACATAMIVFQITSISIYSHSHNTYIIGKTAETICTETVTIEDIGRAWTGMTFRYIATFHMQYPHTKEGFADKIITTSTKRVRVRGELIGVHHNEAPRPGDKLVIIIQAIQVQVGFYRYRLEYFLPVAS